MNPIFSVSMGLYPDFTTTMMFMAVGLIIVFVVLCGLAVFTQLFGYVFTHAEKLNKKAQPSPAANAVVAAPKAVSAQPTPTANVADSRILAIISAAVFTVLKSPNCRIVSVTPAPYDAGWANSGRQSIFTSHTPKK